MYQRTYQNGAIKVERIVVNGRVMWGYEAGYGATIRNGHRGDKAAAIRAAKSAVEELAKATRLNHRQRVM